MGLFRQGTFILDLSGHLTGVPTGLSDATFTFGQAGGIPIVADWSGSGTAKVGVFLNGNWLVDYTGGRAVSGLNRSYVYGVAGDIPVVGDWDSSGNPPKIGIYRAGLWILDYDGDNVLTTPSLNEMVVGFGVAGYTPLWYSGSWEFNPDGGKTRSQPFFEARNCPCRNSMDVSPLAQLSRTRMHWAAGEIRLAVESLEEAARIAPGEGSVREMTVRLLEQQPSEVTLEMAPFLLRLLRDPEVEPDPLNCAGWMLERRVTALFQDARNESGFEQLVKHLEGDELSLTLLRESPVGDRVVEKTLTCLRRWLAVSGRWRDHPLLVDALGAQADLNGGAWYFDDEERSLLDDVVGNCHLLAHTFQTVHVSRPDNLREREVEPLHPVTGGKLAQYERWPYPAWRRMTFPEPGTFPKAIRNLGAHVATGFRDDSSILVAGCGTGREAAMVALQMAGRKT